MTKPASCEAAGQLGFAEGVLMVCGWEADARGGRTDGIRDAIERIEAVQDLLRAELEVGT